MTESANTLGWEIFHRKAQPEEAVEVLVSVSTAQGRGYVSTMNM